MQSFQTMPKPDQVLDSIASHIWQRAPKICLVGLCDLLLTLVEAMAMMWWLAVLLFRRGRH